MVKYAAGSPCRALSSSPVFSKQDTLHAYEQELPQISPPPHPTPPPAGRQWASDLEEVCVGGRSQHEKKKKHQWEKSLYDAMFHPSVQTQTCGDIWGGGGRGDTCSSLLSNELWEKWRRWQRERWIERERGRKWPSAVLCTTVTVWRGDEDTESRTQQQPFVCVCHAFFPPPALYFSFLLKCFLFSFYLSSFYLFFCIHCISLFPWYLIFARHNCKCQLISVNTWL